MNNIIRKYMCHIKTTRHKDLSVLMGGGHMLKLEVVGPTFVEKICRQCFSTDSLCKFRNKSINKLLIIMLFFSFLITGCSEGNQSSVDIRETQSKREPVTLSPKVDGEVPKGAFVGTKDQAYFMCVFVQDAEYWKGVYEGFRAAGEQLGVRTVFAGCNDYDPAAQLKVFEQIIAKKPRGIALSPINAEIFKEPINRAMAMGIKVTCFASDSPDSNRLTLVTSDNVSEGRFAARYIAEKLGNKGEIGIIERPNQTNHAKRVKAFMETLSQEFPNMKVVARETADGDSIRASKIATTMIKNNPNLSLIYCVAGIEGIGAATGVKESGKEVKVFCYDADPKVIDMIKEGTIYAAIQPNSVNQGYWSMLSLFIASNNLINPISDWKSANKSPLPALIDNGLDVVTKENCDMFILK